MTSPDKKATITNADVRRVAEILDEETTLAEIDKLPIGKVRAELRGHGIDAEGALARIKEKLEELTPPHEG